MDGMQPQEGMQAQEDPTAPPQPKGKQQRHPIHTIQDILNQTPPDMIEHEYKQGADGSIEIKIKIPGRAEQAKQRAMQQAEQAMQQAGGVGAMPSPGGASPAGAGAGAGPSGPGGGMSAGGGDKAASTTNVVVKVAMTPKDIGTSLKERYPEAFLRKMGLL